MPARIVTIDDVFSVYPDMVVHPVNCTSVCKDVFSKQLKRTSPEYFRHYTRAVLRHQLKPGMPEVFEHGALFGTRHLVILPVKNHWKDALLPPLVKECLARLAETLTHTRPLTLAMPDLAGPPAGWLAAQFEKMGPDLPFDLSVYLWRDAVDAV